MTQPSVAAPTEPSFGSLEGQPRLLSVGAEIDRSGRAMDRRSAKTIAPDLAIADGVINWMLRVNPVTGV
jgi:hypothetical protein